MCLPAGPVEHLHLSEPGRRQVAAQLSKYSADADVLVSTMSILPAGLVYAQAL